MINGKECNHKWKILRDFGEGLVHFYCEKCCDLIILQYGKDVGYYRKMNITETEGDKE